MKYNMGDIIYEVVTVGYAKFELREHKIIGILNDTFGIMYDVQDCGLVSEEIIDVYHHSSDVDDYNSIFSSSKKKALEILIKREMEHEAIANQVVVIAESAIRWANEQLEKGDNA